MTRRTDFTKILNHQNASRTILDLGGNPLSTMEGKSADMLLNLLGYKTLPHVYETFGKTRRVDERILKYLDIDTRSVGTILTPRESLYNIISSTEYIDEWGIRRKFDGMYWDNTHNPLKGTDIDDLKSYKWPDPESIDYTILDEYEARARDLYENTDYIICAEHPVYGIFELGCWMCGFDDFLIKMVLDTDYVKYFFEKVFQYQSRIIEIYYKKIGRYIHYTSSGDDFATQNSLFMSGDMFRSLIKPYFSERIRLTRKYTDAAFLHHSCGCVHDIIDDLIDSGVQILNPIQPVNEKMQPAVLKSKFGSRIVFHGGLDTQTVLPFGSRESIEESVNNLLSVMEKDGGYIFAAAHNIQEDVPPENVIHMFETARKYKQRRNII
jgi:uroporphyrinogen decarboxylase